MEIYIGYYLECGGDLPIASRDLAGRRVWMASTSSTLSGLVGRALKSRMDVLAWLFEAVLGCFQISLNSVRISKPHLGICRQLAGYKIPWPLTFEQRVHWHVGAFTSQRPIRFARDLARSWP